MAICDKGHYFNHQQHAACPICRPRAQPAVALPVAPPARTVLDRPPTVEARLMGFLVVVESRHEDLHRYFRLVQGANLIGRVGARIELRDPEVSQEHALVVCTRPASYVIDLDSTHQVFVNGEVVACGPLAAGDELRIGQTRMKFVPFALEAEEAA